MTIERLKVLVSKVIISTNIQQFSHVMNEKQGTEQQFGRIDEMITKGLLHSNPNSLLATQLHELSQDIRNLWASHLYEFNDFDSIEF